MASPDATASATAMPTALDVKALPTDPSPTPRSRSRSTSARKPSPPPPPPPAPLPEATKRPRRSSSPKSVSSARKPPPPSADKPRPEKVSLLEGDPDEDEGEDEAPVEPKRGPDPTKVELTLVVKSETETKTRTKPKESARSKPPAPDTEADEEEGMDDDILGLEESLDDAGKPGKASRPSAPRMGSDHRPPAAVSADTCCACCGMETKIPRKCLKMCTPRKYILCSFFSVCIAILLAITVILLLNQLLQSGSIPTDAYVSCTREVLVPVLSSNGTVVHNNVTLETDKWPDVIKKYALGVCIGRR